MAESLKKQFPGEEEAIDEFMRLMKVKKRKVIIDLYVIRGESERAKASYH